MKAIHAEKFGAVMEMKTKALFSKNFIIMPVFAIGITVIMKIVYSAIAEGGEMAGFMTGMALSLGVLMNVTMTGIYCVCGTMAEEKEKHTLRVLMTSSVNGIEFFLGSVIPVIVMVVLTNILMVPLVGISMSASAWGAYIGISILSAAAASVIGMVFGIFSKDQVTAGTITSPVLMVLMMLPIFAQFNDTVNTIAGFLFTGVLRQTVERIALGQDHIVDVKGAAIVAVEVVLAFICFLAFYRRNGYDKD